MPTKLRQLALSDPIPNYPMTLQGFLKPELKDAIRRAFLDLKDPAILKLFRVEAIAAATDKDYDVLRDMAKVLATRHRQAVTDEIRFARHLTPFSPISDAPPCAGRGWSA